VSIFSINWVRKRDARLQPFDPDKISRALFAAGEQLGRPDPFLARELADGVLHFLSGEVTGAVITSEQIRDLVVKVVRELGQPALARVFEQGGPGRLTAAEGEASDASPAGAQLNEPGIEVRRHALSVGSPSNDPEEVARSIEEAASPAEAAWGIAGPVLRGYALRAIFSRDLQAAARDGLLVLGGLDAPLEIAGCILRIDFPDSAQLLSAIEQARSLAGRFVVMDGVEYLLARKRAAANSVGSFVHVLQVGLCGARLAGVLNLNCNAPPPAGEELVLGPLFDERSQGPDEAGLDALREELLEAIFHLDPGQSRIRIDWHLRADDFRPAALTRLQRIARRIQEGFPLTFVFDRPKGTVPLAEGLDRRHPALLMEVGVSLPRLLDQRSPSLDPVKFVTKIGSLARLALSSGTQKRDYLRRQSVRRPLLSAGFLLDRARLKVVPLGLKQAVHRVLGAAAPGEEAEDELSRQVLARLERVLQEDGKSRLLDTCVGPAFPSMDFAEGDQLLPPAVGQETIVLAAQRDLPSPEQVIDILRQAWQRPQIVRVRWQSSRTAPRQLLAPWEPRCHS
jgi:hypothetical protein